MRDMTFQNLPVEPGALPQVSAFNFQPMAPAYPKEVRLQHGIVWAIVVLAQVIPSIVVAKPLGLKMALLGLPVLGLIMGIGFTALAVKSARVKGPMGWFMPSFMTVSMSSRVPTSW